VLGDLRAMLRSIAQLDDADLERLVGWFSQHVNRWGQTPRSTGLRVDPHARRDPPQTSKGQIERRSP
jgi:hypothetical protein